MKDYKPPYSIEAYDMIQEIDPFSLKDLKRVHGVMEKFLEVEAGEFRSGDEGVFNGDENSLFYRSNYLLY